MGSQSRAQEGGSGIMRSNERVAAWLMRVMGHGSSWGFDGGVL